MLVKKDNINLSNEIDFLSEAYRDECELKVISMLDEVDEKIENGEKWLSSSELKSKLDI